MPARMSPPLVTTAAQLRRDTRRGNLRHLTLGVLLGVTVTWYTAVPSEDSTRLEKLFVLVADHVCRYQDGYTAISKVPTRWWQGWWEPSRRFRFECRTGVVIEQDVVLR